MKLLSQYLWACLDLLDITRLISKAVMPIYTVLSLYESFWCSTSSSSLDSFQLILLIWWVLNSYHYGFIFFYLSLFKLIIFLYIYLTTVFFFAYFEWALFSCLSFFYLICRNSFILNIVVPTYTEGIPFKTPSRFLKPWKVLNPMYTVFFPIHTYLYEI